MFVPRIALALSFALSLLSAAAQAQIVLPGAVLRGAAHPKRPAADTEAQPVARKKARRPVSGEGGGAGAGAGKPPGEEAIAGRTLSLNGGAGALEFQRHDKALQIKTLAFRGELSAKSGEACDVSVSLATPLTAKPAGQPAGLLRYDVELEACPFSFDILDDAVLVSSPGVTCEFKQAGCQVSASGLWGPKAGAFTPAKAKEVERARTRWEASVRAGFREAVAAAKDKDAVKQAAKEQAGFSSDREEACRDYAGESTHGFCAARLTQARAFALRARTAQLAAAGAAEKAEGKKKK